MERSESECPRLRRSVVDCGGLQLSCGRRGNNRPEKNVSDKMLELRQLDFRTWTYRFGILELNIYLVKRNFSKHLQMSET